MLPAGLAVGWLTGWAWRRAGVAGRAAVVVAGAACLLAGGVAYVRPGLLPGGAGWLVSAKERIGPPRVVAGEGFFTKTVVGGDSRASGRRVRRHARDGKAGQIVYDEILARSMSAQAAPDGGAGRQMLLLSGDGLSAYRK